MKRKCAGFMSGIAWGLMVLSGLLFPLALAASERVALVIGNGAYEHATPLNNPPNDAEAVAAALGRMGFQVHRVNDADIRQLTRELAAFRQQSRAAEVAVLYYAGHAIQVEGRNYLVPVDAEIRELGDVSLSLVPLGAALQQLQSEVNVIILDACRDNPFEQELSRSATQQGRSLGSTRGLGREESLLGGGTYLMMAAAPDAVALDGPPGGNSPFTAALLEYLEEPGLELSQLHRQVRRTVEQRTQGAQSPEAIDRLPPRPVYLAGLSVEPSVGATTSVAPSPSDPQALELAFWQSIHNSREAGDFEAYLEQYPQGNFAALARSRIAALRNPTLTETAPVPPSAPALARLSVKATPVDARIRIMNIVPVYQDGMELTPGRYDLEVSAQGYETHRRWYDLAAGDRVLEVVLERTPVPARVEPAPAPIASTPLPAAPRPGARPSTGTRHQDRLRDGTRGPEMVFIRGGPFVMGSPAGEAGRISDERQHRVTVGDVWVGRYEVTFDEYDRFARATGRALPNDQSWGRGRRAVVNVSWDDATAYAGWLSQQTDHQYRLPTEVEWEYAARAGTTTAYFWGNDADAACAYANVRDETFMRVNGFTRTHHRCDDRHPEVAAVGQFSPNVWGLHDMLGNVWEWTCSAYDADYGGAEQLCRASGQRAVRGGSWLSQPDRVRSAFRNRFSPGARINFLGFRLARSP